eukprot:CAMPEP_0171460224 /NCGR_PEP_ID=MMETSP0945-20130129/5176_1 /TAXON_ID=109269 /ORGANISM="Vaucheria litorea, Strain CCMP2940" /LENGTH=487 /DNA_ID=CAMNT_0011986365 /DNA_START=18 /DNA_END=1482 /DNA_ORIENTATION=+
MATENNEILMNASAAAAGPHAQSLFALSKMDSNPFFTGGVGLALIGAAAGISKRFGNTGNDGTETLVNDFGSHEQRREFPVGASLADKAGTSIAAPQRQHKQMKNVDGTSRLVFNMMPGPGRHLIPYKGKWFWVERERQVNSVTLESGKPWEKVLLTTFGRDPSVFDWLLEDAEKESSTSSANQNDSITIYTSWGAEWKPFGHPKRKRSIQSVVLDDNISENIIKDLNEWKDSSKWYYERGVPYRRGYLLHGPPGSGKTSFIYAIAGEMNYDICMLSLGDEGLSDDRLAHALTHAPQRTIILLEDVDAAFVNRNAAHSSRGMVTFSGLLNTLDGVTSSEERLIFMTTNFIERLDPALLRPGRVDFVQYIGDASKSQIVKLFQRFYPKTDLHLAEQFAVEVLSSTNGKKISMASLQGHLLLYKNEPIRAIESAKKHFSRLENETHQSNVRISQGREIDQSDRLKRVRKPITAFEMDKIYFNPQKGSGF